MPPTNPATPTAPTPQAPVSAPPATPATSAPAAVAPAAPASTAPAAAAPKPGDPADGFKSEESKNAVLADLAKERDARQALEAKLTEFETSNTARNQALALALGLTEAPKTEDDLAETVKSIQSTLAASQLEAMRLRVAASPGVDAEGKSLPAIPPEYQALLTETDPEKLNAQAVMVSALVAAKAAADGTPQFQPNPGQGQQPGVGSPLDAQIAEATAAGDFQKAIALKQQRAADLKTKKP